MALLIDLDHLMKHRRFRGLGEDATKGNREGRSMAVATALERFSGVRGDAT